MHTYVRDVKATKPLFLRVISAYLAIGLTIFKIP